ncbi:hypothetical protein [Homoserinimonas hongtaonis]|uniref:Uncharacterized protein n=1 Tax=Homoserinimonas hongtaonis TaxID=2079791 RepID=A0A2U1SZT8_9MICO|nr:hypothetical protein [Salinibacterium hongtaonis]PWB97053.1 hypothetical protein DF220_03785 [Salinibacterium hongtaonis]
MPRPKPIRYDIDTWLVMRNDPVMPKAVIRRDRTFRDGKMSELFRVFRWDLDPQKRVQVSGHLTLEEANAAVPYNVEIGSPRGPINGIALMDERR